MPSTGHVVVEGTQSPGEHSQEASSVALRGSQDNNVEKVMYVCTEKVECFMKAPFF